MTDYKKQAQDFLKKHGLSINIEKAVPQKSPLWCEDGKHGINYWVTLYTDCKYLADGTAITQSNSKCYGFDYWGSIADREKIERGSVFEASRARPTAYDILACLNIEDDATTFEDFCSCYGYSTDSRKAEETYRAVMLQSQQLRELLTPEALEDLQAIQ